MSTPQTVQSWAISAFVWLKVSSALAQGDAPLPTDNADAKPESGALATEQAEPQSREHAEPQSDVPQRAGPTEAGVAGDAVAALMAETPSLDSDAPSLQVYGFADFNLKRAFADPKNIGQEIFKVSTFFVGNVNTYLAANLTHGFSSLLEIRFSYMPSGTNEEGGKFQTTYASDAASFGRQERWGGIVLQRVHLDYTYSGALHVRVGQFLTPYGIWNVDHGSPTIIGTSKPYPIGNAYFPERQTGLELFGSLLLRDTTLGYHLTVSNGRGDIETSDFDGNKAVGARVFVATDALGSLKIGLSGYGGRATLGAAYPLSFANGQPTLKLATTNQYDELDLGCDLLWEWKNLRIQAEGLMSQVRYTNAGRLIRTNIAGAPIGLVADHIAWGWYGLIGYRLPWWSIMPYFYVEQFRDAPGAGLTNGGFDSGSRALANNLGVNVRPVASVVLKVQGTLVNLPAAHADLKLITVQTAWAF